MADNFEEILLAFKKANVDFMLVGGYVVNHYGYNRTTGDIDIWVKPITENQSKVLSALTNLGFEKDELNKVGSLDFATPFSFKIAGEPIDLDVFNTITGVAYEEAEKNMGDFPLTDSSVNCIDLRDLLTNKMLTNRTKDKLDVEELQKIVEARKKK